MDNNENLYPDYDSIEKMFNFYLEKMGMPNIDTKGIQYQEIKRAFFGGSAAILVFIEEIAELDNHDFYNFMDMIYMEIKKFFYSETEKQNNK